MCSCIDSQENDWLVACSLGKFEKCLHLLGGEGIFAWLVFVVIPVGNLYFREPRHGGNALSLNAILQLMSEITVNDVNLVEPLPIRHIKEDGIYE